MNELIYYLKNIYYTVGTYPLILRIASVLILFFCVVYLFTLSQLFFVQWKYKKNNRINRKLKDGLPVLIEKILFDTEQWDSMMVENAFFEFKISKFVQNNVTDLLADLLEKSESYNLFNYNQIIYHFDLKLFWEKRLLKGNVHQKIKALAKIISIRLVISESVIISMVYHKNSLVRKKARRAYIFLSPHDPFRFFNEDFDNDFTEWDKVQIHEILLLRSKDRCPNFAQWIKRTENLDLKCFFIYETAFFNQQENLPFLITLLSQTNDYKLRQSLIEAIGKLQKNKLEEEVISNYDFEPIFIQKSIIESIHRSLPDDGLEFLETAFYKSYDVELKIAIGKAIANYKDRGVNVLERMEKKNEDQFQDLIFKHIKNPLISA